jgi:aspartate/methionine/tyrosine aminotransferase
MFSSRTAWDRSTNRLASLLDQRKLPPDSILDLTETNPTRVGLRYPDAEILESLAHPSVLSYEPDPRGLPAAREAISLHFAERGVQVDPGDLFLTASTSEAYSWLLKLLADPGDEVLVPHPSYPLFDYLCRLESVRPVPYLLPAEGVWPMDLSALISSWGPAARAVVVVSPNNPTGAYLKRSELLDLTRFCRGKGMALIGDEVFAEYPAGPDPFRAASVLEAEDVLSFSLGGLSKMAGLPQLKLAWIALGGPEILRREARERLEVIGDTYLSVNTPVMRAAPSLLELSRGIRREISSRLEANRRFLRKRVGTGSPTRAFPGEGGWSAVLRIPAVMSEEDWVLSLLERDRVLVHPGYFFDFPSPAYLVLSLLPREEEFREGLERILSRMDQI